MTLKNVLKKARGVLAGGLLVMVPMLQTEGCNMQQLNDLVNQVTEELNHGWMDPVVPCYTLGVDHAVACES